MEKIDLKYVEELFNWTEECEEMTALYEQEECQFELKDKLGSFLDLVGNYAEKKDIAEVHKMDEYGSDDRFCYWIRFKNKVIEIGMYYNDVVYTYANPDNVYEENILNCEDIIEFQNNVNKDILLEDFKPVKITEDMKKDVLEHPERYMNCPPRIRMGNFYTDEEYEQYVEETLNKPLPGDDMKTMIISAFPGCGKTYISENQDIYNYMVMDSDSSKFEKHDGWEKEYVDHIISNIGKYDFIFIAQYPKVLELLNENGIPFVVVAPDNSENLSMKERQLIKQQWFGRFLLRNNSHIKDLERWIEELKANYDEWTSYEHLTEHNPSELVLLKENEYLSDRIEYLYTKKEETKSGKQKLINIFKNKKMTK